MRHVHELEVIRQRQFQRPSILINPKPNDSKAIGTLEEYINVFRFCLVHMKIKSETRGKPRYWLTCLMNFPSSSLFF